MKFRDLIKVFTELNWLCAESFWSKMEEPQLRLISPYMKGPSVSTLYINISILQNFSLSFPNNKEIQKQKWVIMPCSTVLCLLFLHVTAHVSTYCSKDNRRPQVEPCYWEGINPPPCMSVKTSPNCTETRNHHQTSKYMYLEAFYYILRCFTNFPHIILYHMTVCK